MNIIGRDLIMQRWNVIQHELMPELKQECGALTPKLEKLVHILDWVRIEEWSVQTWQGIGRKPHDRSALANAFVAKAVLGLATTRALIERLAMDRTLKRLCGFSMSKVVPDEATFSRAFAEFAQAKLAERVHEALVKNHLGGSLIGHISRDGTAIEAREKPAKKALVPKPPKSKKARRGRVKRIVVTAPKVNRIRQQRTQTLPAMLRDLPSVCDRGTKCNAQGYILRPHMMAATRTTICDNLYCKKEIEHCAKVGYGEPYINIKPRAWKTVSTTQRLPKSVLSNGLMLSSPPP
jgi:hypothetical protein